MTRFVDKYLSDRIEGWPVEVGPMFSTQITRVDSGSEQANQRWLDALREINVPQGVRDHETFEAIKRHWLVMAGPARTWPWRDPTDYATVDLEAPGFHVAPVVAGTDQQFGVGDGATLEFQLIKTYDLGSPAAPYERNIHFPVTSSVIVTINGALPGALSPPITYSVTRPGGKVLFDTPPALGAVLRWGGLFDLQVRFADDQTFKGIMQTYGVSGFADIPLQEVRFCQD